MSASQDELLEYEEVKRRWPRVAKRRRLEILSRQGWFPPFIRFQPRGPALWRADMVAQWYADRFSLEAAA